MKYYTTWLKAFITNAVKYGVVSAATTFGVGYVGYKLYDHHQRKKIPQSIDDDSIIYEGEIITEEDLQ